MALSCGIHVVELSTAEDAEAGLFMFTGDHGGTPSRRLRQPQALKETDRCLNVMPLFHGHGLIANVLTSLAAGASRLYSGVVTSIAPLAG